MSDVLTRAARVRIAIFDVDGVLTDGRLFYGDNGQEYKAFHSRDGLGMNMLRASGVEVAIITARNSDVVRHRAKNLGITHVYQGAEDKLSAYLHLLENTGVTPEQTAYMGDDVVDLPILRRSGLALTVPGAPDIVRDAVHYITRLEGGMGAAREACEVIMRAQDTWEAQLARYNR
jgi:3-deoxy-D-manno-octulosonate 8-phosphate phosphatase (KDO 8-P phosphatase)